MHNNKRKFISTMLFLSVIAAFITGILLHPFADIHALKLAHAVSSLLLVIFCLIHTMQYKRHSRKKVTTTEDYS